MSVNYSYDLNQFAVDTINNAVVVIEKFSNRFVVRLRNDSAQPGKIRQLVNCENHSLHEVAGIDFRVFRDVTV